VTVEHFAEIARSLRPGAEITVGDRLLPFPTGFDDSALRAHATEVYQTPLEEGIAETLAHFEGPPTADR
jgi:hypothetical protein